MTRRRDSNLVRQQANDLPAEASAAALAPNSIAVVLGTRPEMIKLREIVRLLGPAGRLIHTGQHYDHSLSRALFAELELPEPALRLEVGGAGRGTQIGEALSELDRSFTLDRPAAVVVQGDTNSAAAGALAANSSNVPLVHIEAGLRSFDRAMPEEHNRILVDHLADLCCTPTATTAANLSAEGLEASRIMQTGNTVVEAVHHYLPPRPERDSILRRFGLEYERFVLCTFHRPENVDRTEALALILDQLAELRRPVVLPMHPRTAARLQSSHLVPKSDSLRIIEPVGYRNFLSLAADAALLISDSGGVQEEASVLKRPVVVVRRSTERPEVLGTFATLVSQRQRIAEVSCRLLAESQRVHARLRTIPSPYGDGTASVRSIQGLLDLVGRSEKAGTFCN
jgi:UDP-N-acetylglucosamine 2-epimerase (non-hydrolysing)